MAADLSTKPDLTDVLWAFVQRGMWPGSQKTIDFLLKMGSISQMQAYVNSHTHVRAGVLGPPPAFVLKALGPEMGNQVNWLAADGGVAKILIQSAAQGWDAAKTEAHLESLPWWQNHNQDQKKWIVGGKADKLQAQEAVAQRLSDQYLSLYGELKPPSNFMKDALSVASGAQSIDQWVQKQRQSNEYKQRYPGLAARQAAGLPAISETDYRNLEESYKDVMSQYGIDPKQFDQPGDFTNFFARDMQPQELGKRLDAYRTLEGPAGQFVRQQFAQAVGLGNQPLATADMYGLLTDQRKDLAAHYANQTGTPLGQLPDLYSVTAALKSAQNANAAEFNSGGAVVNAPSTGQAEKVPEQMAQAF